MEGRRGVEEEGRGEEEEGRGVEEEGRGAEDADRGRKGEEVRPVKRRVVRFKPSHTICEISDEDEHEDCDELDDYRVNENEHSEDNDIDTESDNETDNEISSDSDSEPDSEWNPSDVEHDLEIEDFVLDQNVELDRDFENGGIAKPFNKCTKDTQANKLRDMSNLHQDYGLKLAFSRKFIKDHEEKERKKRNHRKKGNVGGGGDRGGGGGGEREGEGGGTGREEEGGGGEERGEENGVWLVEGGDLRNSRELAILVMIKDANLSMGQYNIVRFVLEDRALLGESNSTLPSWGKLTEEVHIIHHHSASVKFTPQNYFCKN